MNPQKRNTQHRDPETIQLQYRSENKIEYEELNQQRCVANNFQVDDRQQSAGKRSRQAQKSSDQPDEQSQYDAVSSNLKSYKQPIDERTPDQFSVDYFVEILRHPVPLPGIVHVVSTLQGYPYQATGKNNELDYIKRSTLPPF